MPSPDTMSASLAAGAGVDLGATQPASVQTEQTSANGEAVVVHSATVQARLQVEEQVANLSTKDEFLQSIQPLPASKWPTETCGICCTDDPYGMNGEHPPVKFSCNHVFGLECIMEWFGESNTCPMCRKEFFQKDEVEEPEWMLYDDDSDYFCFDDLDFLNSDYENPWPEDPLVIDDGADDASEFEPDDASEVESDESDEEETRQRSRGRQVSRVRGHRRSPVRSSSVISISSEEEDSILLTNRAGEICGVSRNQGQELQTTNSFMTRGHALRNRYVRSSSVISIRSDDEDQSDRPFHPPTHQQSRDVPQRRSPRLHQEEEEGETNTDHWLRRSPRFQRTLRVDTPISVTSEDTDMEEASEPESEADGEEEYIPTPVESSRKLQLEEDSESEQSDGEYRPSNKRQRFTEDQAQPVPMRNLRTRRATETLSTQQ